MYQTIIQYRNIPAVVILIGLEINSSVHSVWDRQILFKNGVETSLKTNTNTTLQACKDIMFCSIIIKYSINQKKIIFDYDIF